MKTSRASSATDRAGANKFPQPSNPAVAHIVCYFRTTDCQSVRSVPVVYRTCSSIVSLLRLSHCLELRQHIVLPSQHPTNIPAVQYSAYTELSDIYILCDRRLHIVYAIQHHKLVRKPGCSRNTCVPSLGVAALVAGAVYCRIASRPLLTAALLHSAEWPGAGQKQLAAL